MRERADPLECSGRVLGPREPDVHVGYASRARRAVFLRSGVVITEHLGGVPGFRWSHRATEETFVPVVCGDPRRSLVSAVPTVVWILTALGFVAIVVLDLVVIARRTTAVTMRQATVWVVFYVALAGLFAVALFVFRSGTSGSEFVAGYITEYSLSVDNLFVFIIIMARFAVPALAVDKVLYIGIVASMVLRGVFIAAGAAAIAAASWVFYIFGAFLVYTAVRLALEGENDENDFRENAVLRGLRRVLPITPDYVGSGLTTRVSGRRMMTPLVIVIAAIGIANVVFALDSIPAIFGLTTDPYIVLTANAFALLGLRQLYFLIGGLLQRIIYLNVGLSVILAFIGVKLVIEALHGSHIDQIGSIPLPEIGIVTSLAFILVTLALTVTASLAKTRLDARRSV
jgi:tellurite resistance protein TerC